MLHISTLAVLLAVGKLLLKWMQYNIALLPKK